MIKLEVLNWIIRTFGKQRVADKFEFTELISEDVNQQQGIKYRITELNFAFQRTDWEHKETDAKKIERWKRELDDITGNSIVSFFAGDMENFSFSKGALKRGKSFALQVKILHEEKIGVTLVPARGGGPS